MSDTERPLSEQTFEPIDNREDLNAAIEELFWKENQGWVKDYFKGKDVTPERQGLFSSTPSYSEEQRDAFAAAMDTIMSGLFKMDIMRADDPAFLEYSDLVPLVNDGVVTREEWKGFVEGHGSVDTGQGNLAKALETMGPELIAALEALAVGTMNGLADKKPEEPYTYSVGEIEKSGFPAGLLDALRKDSLAVELMSGVCGATENLDINDFQLISYSAINEGRAIS